MIYSVRWQLLLSMVAVILITVGMTALFANLAANAEINRLQGQDAAARDERLTKLLSDAYLYDGSWLGSQAVLENASTLYGEHLVLTDLQHQVVADSQDSVIGQYLGTTSTSRHKASVLGVEGPIGTLWFSPGVPTGASLDSVVGAESSGPSLSLLLILSGLLAVGVALILTFFVSHRILRPLESLARVSRLAARRDFTVRAHVQSRDEVGELARTFNTMLAELSRTEELRRNLVGDVAHELRTPLTNIRGYVEGISDGVMQPDAETLTSIRGEIHLLTRLIEDLQDLALVESGQMQLKVRSCDLGDLIKDASLAVHPQAQAKSISLEVDEACRLPIQADAQRVSQVLCNLLVNAITHTPTGGRVQIWARKVEGRVQVSVKDDGPGIAAEDQPYVFERFFRVDKSRSRATGGVGLGLTITRRLVEAHQGQIEVISQAGQGAEFRFTLPLEPVSQPA